MIMQIISETLLQYGLLGVILAWFMMENNKFNKKIYEALIDLKIEIVKMNTNVIRLLRKNNKKKRG